MSADHALLVAFLAAASLLVITPGLDTAFVLRVAATRGLRPAAFAALGVAVGCFCWAALVALGLAALLAASQLAYTVLRWVGAAYLLWVGTRMICYPRGNFPIAADRGERSRAAFTTGALTNLLNPKVGIFYVAFLPQFVPFGVSVAPYIIFLGAIHALLGLAWFALLITATQRISGLLRRSAVVRACDRLTGTVFIGFGVGLALETGLP
ncbi:MAG TPA: LysE family translocator [Steroidobacteraceae bacterium]